MPRASKEFLEGVRLFNEREFFEAHEVWEHLWSESDGQERLNYQGFIQIAACYLQVQRGYFDGARKLFDRASDKFEESEEEFLGVNVRQFMAAASAIIEGLPAAPRGEHMSHQCEFPRIVCK